MFGLDYYDVMILSCVLADCDLGGPHMFFLFILLL